MAPKFSTSRRANPAGLFLVLISIAVFVNGQTPDDRYPIVKNGKLGFIDAQGQEVIAPRFSNAGDFSHFKDGIAPVFEPGVGSGYIDPSGKFVIGPTQAWGWGRPFYEGIAGVLIWGKNGGLNKPGWIDRTGKIVFSADGAEGNYFSDGLMPLPQKGKWGYVDKSFRFVIKPQFDWAEPFSEGRAVVRVGEKWGFIDRSGKIVVTPKYDLAWMFQDGLGLVRTDTPDGTVMSVEGEQTNYRFQYGYVDVDGREVIALQFEKATYFSNGFALASDPKSKLLGVIDKRGMFVNVAQFDEAEEFHEGLAQACVNKKCGYIDTNGLWVIPPTFSYTDNFRSGLARVSWKDGVYGYIDKTGKTIWQYSAGQGLNH